MEKKLSTEVIKKINFQKSCIKKFQNRYNIIKSGIKELDKFIGGFKSGEINFVHCDKNFALSFPYYICVDTYRTYHKNVIYIDGGMSFNPYIVAKYAKKMELDQRTILDNIYVSRAFTLFQLTDLLQHKLEQKIRECNPKTLIIGKFLDLYFDSNISSIESTIIMKSNLRKIKEITKKYELFTLLSNFDGKTEIRKNANKIIYEFTDQIVKINKIGQVISFTREKQNERNSVSIIEKGQLRINDFVI